MALTRLPVRTPRYEVEGDDLCIRIPLDAIAAQAFVQSRGEVRAKDKAALARLLGKELIDCEDPSEQPWLNAPLDAAMERVLESAFAVGMSTKSDNRKEPSMSTARETVDASGARVRIAATYSFEAAHRLPHLPDGHKCKRLHGHNYRLDVAIAGPLDARGFVIDYAELDAVVQPLVDSLDHRYLNEIDGLDNPTSEVMALWFRTRIMASLPGYDPVVRIWETPRYWVEVPA